jgi:hypothetical protein
MKKKNIVFVNGYLLCAETIHCRPDRDSLEDVNKLLLRTIVQ